MSRRIDSERESANDGDASRGEATRELLSHLGAVRGRSATPDNGTAGSVEKSREPIAATLDPQDRRRIREATEQIGVAARMRA
jgi:hypothetical protein